MLGGGVTFLGNLPSRLREYCEIKTSFRRKPETQFTEGNPGSQAQFCVALDPGFRRGDGKSWNFATIRLREGNGSNHPIRSFRAKKAPARTVAFLFERLFALRAFQ